MTSEAAEAALDKEKIVASASSSASSISAELRAVAWADDSGGALTSASPVGLPVAMPTQSSMRRREGSLQ